MRDEGGSRGPDSHAVDVVAMPRSKRCFDLVVASAALLSLSPVLVAVAVGVRMKLGSPVIFSQDRGGLGGRTFKIRKFRTMTGECDADGNLLPDDERRHPFGDFLRASSLDELPALLNVLRCEMSIVGPRPLMAKYLERYSPEQMRRHSVLPGLTGVAQVQGRNALSWEEKFALDLEYVDSQSLLVDLRILKETVGAVLSRGGADGIDHTEEFMGSGPAST